MHVKLFSTLPSQHDYEVKFSPWYFMEFVTTQCQFLNVNAFRKYSLPCIS